MWRSIDEGFPGNVGSEGGQVRVDEEHVGGGRITLEEGGTTAPFAITCGIYGLMFHTVFFATESAAREALAMMKARIEDSRRAGGAACGARGAVRRGVLKCRRADGGIRLSSRSPP